MHFFSGKWFFFLMFIVIFVSLSQTSVANEMQNTFIEDKKDCFTSSEKEAIENEIKKLPENYRIIVIPSIHGDLDEIGRAIFTQRKLSQDTILILIVTENKKIMAFTGEVLANKGLNSSFFQREIELYFVPSVKEKGLSEATIELVKGISKDIPQFLVKDKNSPKIPDVPENVDASDNEKG
ncbi:MAG TPA: TPM domain-containing protein, partial [bacterium]|nr:TPM domain-containing protein [bacterium]